MAIIRFPRTPPVTLPQLWDDTRSAFEQLEPVVLKDVTINTTQTPVAHGLGRIPMIVVPAWQSNTNVWRSAVPDTRCCYYTAAVQTVVDFLVIG